MENTIYILVPVYKVEKYIDECIQSVLKQDYSNYILVLVDDGSPDSCGIICDKYASKYKNIVVIHQKNSGSMDARKTAVNFVLNKKNRNSYCMFLDSDDKLKPHALKTINNYLSSYDCDLLIYGFETFFEDKILYSTHNETDSIKQINNPRDLFRTAVIDKTYNSLWRKAVKSNLAESIVNDFLPKISMGEDLVQSLSLYYNSKNTLIVPDILYLYRSNPESITKTFNLKRYLDDMTSRLEVLKFVNEKNLWNKKDYQDYKEKCIDTLEAWIIQIGNQKDSLKNKIVKLKSIRKNVLYTKYLYHGRHSSVLLFLFKSKLYFIILILFDVKNTLRKIMNPQRR